MERFPTATPGVPLPEQLADTMRRLTDLGMHTISFITGTPFIPQILDALERWHPPLPLVWNTSGYERVETLKRLEGVIDVYLPDLKHYSPRAGRLCAGAPDYFQVASQALKEMCRQTGEMICDEEGIARKGVLVRHLILPGFTGESMKLLTWIRDELPAGTPVSLMRQYIPYNGVSIPGLNRRITEEEYRRVRDHMIALDLPGYLQEPEAADPEFVPVFNQDDSFV